MSIIFRKLAQKRHWDNKPWIEQGDVQADVQADVVNCLRTKENKLSVFMLDGSSDQVTRVVAALALTRDSLANFDLAIAPVDILAQYGIRADRAPGQTPDPEVNGWHQDLVDLTILQLARLAVTIRSKGEIKRYNLKKVGEAIQLSLNGNHIQTENINRNLKSSLTKYGIVQFH